VLAAHAVHLHHLGKQLPLILAGVAVLALFLMRDKGGGKK
jgi:hypothetical protein